MTTILVVDDSLTVRMDLAEALAGAELDAVPCATLAEARAVLRERRIALAILDVRLPDGDGVEFLGELRAAPATADLPILMLSSEAEVADRVRALKTGATDYVGKPYDTELIIARIRELVAVEPGEAARGSLVLLIDDSPTFRATLAGELGAAGYAVVAAPSGSEGLRLAAARRPDAIIVDGVMPDMSGDHVIRRIRLDPALRTTPCLLLTGSDDELAEVHALDAGADAFARKESDATMILARLAAMVRSASEHTPDAGGSTIGPKRILAVDDSTTYLHLIAEELQAEGYDVAQASSGEQAIELLAVQQVDCILLDLIMPGLSGIETCRRIKAAAAFRDVPLVILTAQDSREAMMDALAAGADDFVAKTSDTDVLHARVKAQIRRKKFSDEHRRVRERLLQSEARAAMAEQLEDANRELTASNKELEAFSYTVSHDLRAPLRAIRAFSQILEEEAMERLDLVHREHLRRIIAASLRMGETIDGLLELSRIHRVDFDRSRVDLSAMAAAAIDDLRIRDPERVVDAVIARGVYAHADPRLVRALFDNLIGNAWKFTSQRERARIELGTAEIAEERVYFIRDNGAGFDMAKAERLFVAFERMHGREFPGTGIGLATVRRIVERHAGRVWAESAVGAGTTIYFTLPS